MGRAPNLPPPCSQEDVKEMFDYNESTGALTWKNRPTKHSGGVKVGDLAGYVRPDGARYVRVLGKQYLAHRLAYYWMTGEWPNEIDHKNHGKDDNSANNLRPASRSQNQANKSKQKRKLGPQYKGVYFSRGKYFSVIQKDRVLYRLGCFATAEEAREAYIKKATELYGEFAYAG